MKRLLSSIAIATALVVGFSAVLVVLPQQAVAKKKRGGKGNSAAAKRAAIKRRVGELQREIAAARKLHAAASAKALAAQSAEAASSEQLQWAQGAYAKAKQEAAAATALLKDIESLLQEEQPTDSPLARAQQAVDVAREKVAAAQQRVFQSVEYKANHKRALASADRLKLLPQVRSDALSQSDEFRRAKQEYEANQAILGQTRTALFQADADWVAATEAARQARADVAKAYSAMYGAGVRRGAASANLRGAVRAAEGAARVVAEDSRDVKALQSAAKKTPGGKRAPRAVAASSRPTARQAVQSRCVFPWCWVEAWCSALGATGCLPASAPRGKSRVSQHWLTSSQWHRKTIGRQQTEELSQ